MPKTDGGIDVISQVSLFEVQRWWESEERYRSTITNTNNNLFQPDAAKRTIFASAQLQNIARQQK